MGRRKPRVWPELAPALAGPVMDNHTHLPIHPGEIPSADGVRMALGEQLERARAVGVSRVVTSACEVPALDPSLALARQYPGVRVALAIHPNEAAIHAGHVDPSPDGLTPRREDHHVDLDQALAMVEERLGDPMVVAVGESGLDYYRTAEPGRGAQAQAFRAHIDMAKRHDLPLQIHDRQAHEDVLGILAEMATPDLRVVFHAYSGDRAMAKVLADNGWFASFAGNVTYPSNDGLREAIDELPQELVLVETDAPYLTAIPWRGQPNASYAMTHTVRAIAEYWQVGEDFACAQLDANSTMVYGQW